MAKEISFHERGTKFESDPIRPTSDNIVVRINFKKPGVCDLYRSIDGVEPYVYEAKITNSFPCVMMTETNISGIKDGQYLKLIFAHSEPSKILVLE